MTAAVVHIVSGDAWGGAENQVLQLVKRQQLRSSIKVFVIVLNSGKLLDELRKLSVECVLVDEAQFGFLGLLRQCSIEVSLLRKRFQTTIIHSHRRKENLIALLVSWRFGMSYFRTLHGADEHSHSDSTAKKQLKRLEEGLHRKFCSGTAAVSVELARKIVGAGHPADSVFQINNGIDFEALHIAAEVTSQPPRIVTDESAIRSDARVAIIGRLVPVKRQDLFIEIARRSHEEGLEGVEFLIIGDGPMDSQLKAQAASVDGVAFTGFQENIAPLIAGLDAIFILSDHEGLPLNLLEGIGLDVPVIGRAVGGVAEVLGEYPKLLLTDTVVEQGLAALKALLHNDPEFYQQFQQCKEMVLEKYSLEMCEENYFRMYFLKTGAKS